jgi:hypothetical protein
LDAGKSLAFRDIWNQHDDSGSPVPSGDYLIRGVLLTDDPNGLASVDAPLHIER